MMLLGAVAFGGCCMLGLALAAGQGQTGGPNANANSEKSAAAASATFSIPGASLVKPEDVSDEEWNTRRKRAAASAAALAAYRPVAPPEGLFYQRRSKKGLDGKLEQLRVEPISEDLRREFNINPFFKRTLIIDGIPIIGSEHVSDWAYLEAAWSVDGMLEGRDKIKEALRAGKVRLGIIACTEYTMDIPSNQSERNLESTNNAAFQDGRSRGLGGRLMATCAEENVLSLNRDPYATENITLHEFSHTIDSNLRRADPEWARRLDAIYANAQQKGLWANTYAMSSRGEYWAEGTQSWFDCNRKGRNEDPKVGDGVHNGIWNRALIKEYDPQFAAFLKETWGDEAWRYSKPLKGNRPDNELTHLAGLDRDAMPSYDLQKSPRIILNAGRGRENRGGGGQGRGGRRGANAEGARGGEGRGAGDGGAARRAGGGN